MTETKRPRRSTEGGYARGEETRLRIIQAAIELFGEHGFVAASTRDIAAKAGVNAPALQYYFENKEGVYRACAEHLADEAWKRFEPVVRRSTQTLESSDDVPALIEAFIELQNVMMDKALETSKAPTLRLFFVREQGGREPPIATEIIQERVRRPLMGVATKLVSKICGMPPDDPLTIMRLLSLHGQFMLFHTAPRSLLTLFGWSTLDTEKIEFVKEAVFSNTRTLLRMWAGEHAAAQAARKKNTSAPPRTKRSNRASAKG
ncbi:CerR family C-terminal domain-containing protein [Trinickia diaoshuihuensis]|uniref:CerR family C-terminal domain-containing protein n=1 Tax=Trinickia diaoshuihuensis TaxID=2292265 RepID=UPI000E245326|nr:CerR family C-terminal domain-containing protein [Trinickia diaoshuihuensis]